MPKPRRTFDEQLKIYNETVESARVERHERNLAHYKLNRKALREAQRARYREALAAGEIPPQRQRYRTWHGRVNSLVTGARNRARTKNLPFDLTDDHILHLLEVQAYRCALTGLPLTLDDADSRCHPFAPSLDQIAPSAGYTAKNTRVVCWAVNVARNDFGDDVILTVARALVARHPETSA